MRLACLTVLALCAGSATPLSAQNTVVQARLGKVLIAPVTTEYVAAALKQAKAQNAECVVLVLDVAYGFAASARRMVYLIENSEVPVVVYVPSGGRAASAGFFVAQAGALLAMAPDSTLGPAQPAEIVVLPTYPDLKDTAAEKAVIETVNWARQLATRHERAGEAAAKIVEQRLALTGKEAVETGAADLLAGGVDELLTKLEGQSVKTIRKENPVLQTEKAAVQTTAFNTVQMLQESLANPNLAFVLLILGFCGVLFPFARRTWRFLDYLAVVCMVLGLVGFTMQPVQLMAMFLMVLALFIYAGGIFAPAYGILPLLGSAALIIAGMTLFEATPAFLGISLWLLIAGAVFATLITIALGRYYRLHVQRATPLAA